MMKSGHRLADVPGISLAIVGSLRELSVTTAEEVLGLATSSRDSLARLLGGPAEAERLVTLVRHALPPEDASLIEDGTAANYPYATGFDPPLTGKKTY